jgi:hypothetical protein
VARGNSVFARPMLTPQVSRAVVGPVVANDIFLHALFARITLTNNETIEFETKFNRATNTIELQIEDRHRALFNQLTGIQRGPIFQEFVNWLIGSNTLITPSTSDKLDGEFIPSSNIDIWFGGTQVAIDNNAIAINLPTNEPSVLGHNLKTSPTLKPGYLQVYLIWKFICGSNTSFDIRSMAHITDINGESPVDIVSDTNISTFNLVSGDVRETLILDTGNAVSPDNIINLQFLRNFQGSPDPKTESIGVLGIRLKLGA